METFIPIKNIFQGILKRSKNMMDEKSELKKKFLMTYIRYFRMKTY